MRNNHRVLAIVGLVVLLAMGAVVRLHNISEYKFYPDSYQSLLVARNLSQQGSPVGSLGRDGMWYPDFIDWTRPLYPLLINAVRPLTPTQPGAAHLVAFVASLLAILLAYVLVKRLTGRRLPALAGAALAAVSYELTVWSGFIMTEALGVFMIMLLLERATFAVHKGRARWFWPDILAGLALGLAFLTRYEYMLLAVPAYILYRFDNRTESKRLGVVYGAAILPIISCFIWYPLPFPAHEIVARFWLPMAAIIGTILAVEAVWRLRHRLATDSRKLAITVGAVFAVYLLAVLTGVIKAYGLRQFMVHDWLLFTLAIAGCWLLFHDRRYRLFGLASLAGATLLLAAYLKVNPSMERYYTHLLPFMLLPAALAAEWLVRRKKTVALIVIAGLLGLQVWQSFRGMHGRDGGIWFQPGYEEVSAQLLAGELDPGAQLQSGDLLLVSFPEPYAYVTGHSTYSLSDEPPFIYIDPSLDSRSIEIVDDMGMRQIFPQFSRFLGGEGMAKYKVGEYRTGVRYRYTDFIEPESGGVKLYKMRMADLKEALAAYSQNHYH